jgi:O-antigen/teichoic acid export membrane protein
MGIPHLIVKELSYDFTNKVFSFFESKVLLFCFLSSFFIFLISALIINIYYSNIDYKYLIFLSSLFTIFNSIFFYYFIAIKKIILGNFIDQILKYLLLIVFIFSIFFLNIQFTIFNLIIIYCIANFTIFFIFILFTVNEKKVFLKENKKEIKYKEYLKYIFFTGLTSLFTILNTKIDILLIKYFLDEIQVSIYGIGSQLSLIMNMPLVVFLHILMPKIASLIKKKKQMQLNILSDLYRFILFFLCTLLILSLGLYYKNIILLFFNENYLESYNIFIIISLSYLIMSFFSFNDIFLIYSGKEIKILVCMFLSFLVNICTSLILIPNYGIVGAAIALSLSNVFLSFSLFIINIKNNYLFRYILRIIFKNKLWLIKKL